MTKSTADENVRPVRHDKDNTASRSHPEDRRRQSLFALRIQI